MKNFFSLFQGVFTFFKTISKSMYRRCAIIASGSAVIAVVCLNSTCYGGGGKNNVVSDFSGTGQAEDTLEDEDEDTEEEKRMFASLIVDTAMTSTSDSMSKPLMAGYTISGFKKYRCVYTEVEADEDESEMVQVSADYINPIISITEEDYNNLVRIVEAEATDLDDIAKILVANVVINRVFSDVFPDTVTEVIFQGNGAQFSPVMDGRFYSVQPKESSYEAVDRALVGEDYSEGALFFAATASAGEGSWFARRLQRLFEYKGHVFFCYK